MYNIVIFNITQFLAGVCIIWVRSEWSTVYGIITVIATIEGSYAAEFDDYTGLKYFALYSIVNLAVTYDYFLFIESHLACYFCLGILFHVLAYVTILTECLE